MTLVDLALGPRPDEPGPPINGPAAYPPDVQSRLAADAATIVGKYPQPRSALLPLLHLVQAEDGYVSTAGIRFCAAQLDLTDAEVSAVATFYSMYRRTPTGTYLVGVCTNTLCAVMGGDAILATLEHHLGITAGQTTADGALTLEHLECNAACDYAPVIMVNWQFYDNQTPTTATTLTDTLRSPTPQHPTRGTPLPTFTTTCRVLAGLPTDLGEGTGPGPATLAGLRIAAEHDMQAPADTGPAAAPSSSADAPEPEAVDSVRDEPAPAPSATVPAEPGTAETDPSTTGD